MDPAYAALRELGGVCTAAELRAVVTARQVRDAVADGRIVRIRRGGYAVPHYWEATGVAVKLSGALAVSSAAVAHGWKVVRTPTRPWVAVSLNRKVPAAHRALAHVVHSAAPTVVLPAPENAPARPKVAVTAAVPTVLDCARRLPYAEAVAVADSALRSGAVTSEQLLEAAARLRGPGSATVRRVVAEATPLAQSPFESVLRVLCREAAGLQVVPQVEIDLGDFVVHPDLVDERLRIVAEADSWAHHASTPDRFARDLRRYTLLTSLGWTVLRFGYNEVVDEQDRVLSVLRRTVVLRRLA